MGQTRLIAAFAAAISFLLAGCASPGNVAKEAVDANRAIERQNNDLLLLNIVRASRDMPLHFSRINTLRLTAGEVGLGASKLLYPGIGSAGAAGQSLYRRLGVELGVNGPALPALDVTPLDGQEYMQGIMAPVASPTLPLLSELGWRPELLMRLLVDSVTITDEAGVVRILQNDPSIADDFKKFETFVIGVTDGTCVFVPKNGPPVRFSPDYHSRRDASPSLEGVAAAKANGLAPELVTPDTFYFAATPKQVEIKCSQSDSENQAPPPAYEGSAAALLSGLGDREAVRTDKKLQAQLRSLLSIKPRAADGMPPAPTPATAPPMAGAKPTEISAKLRSPYGVLMYLGSLMKANDARFTIARGSGDGTRAIARAEVLGDHYYVSADPVSVNGDTIKSLSIAWQLLQLQSKGSTAPVTGTVRIAQ
jgi:hypothetical protein